MSISLAPGTYKRRIQSTDGFYRLDFTVTGAVPAVIENEADLLSFLFWQRDAALTGPEIWAKDGKGSDPQAEATAKAKETSFNGMTLPQKETHFRDNSPHAIPPWQSPGLAQVRFDGWTKL